MYSGCRRWYLRDRNKAHVVWPRTKSEGMSEYSQGRERILFRIGLPFWRGETKIDEADWRAGRGWGLGCTTLRALSGGRGRECVGAMSRTAVRSLSSPYSSGMLSGEVTVGVKSKEATVIAEGAGARRRSARDRQFIEVVTLGLDHCFWRNECQGAIGPCWKPKGGGVRERSDG